MRKLSHYQKCTAQIHLLTGMHIGGPKETVKIGGIDNPVIRNPITNMPYIPGSSLKGRFRMSLELKYSDVSVEYSGGNENKIKGVGPSENTNHESMVAILFGNAKPQKDREPTRLIFRDSNISSVSEDYVQGEEKIELKMDRESFKGYKGQNRTQERIAAGAKFDFELMMRVFEGDNEEIFKSRVEEAMKIVEAEFLGGSGTRGYGQVKFENIQWEKVDI
jgi:CRISPR-associated protein Csm3